MAFLKTLRNALLVAIAFAGAGWYGGYDYEHRTLEHLMGFAERGYCLAKDPAKTRYWYACQDAAVALELQTREAQRDADTKSILADMGKKRGKR